ncbi:MAG: hypothetical protein Q8941_21295 [Bacteroidota bacterium]|nr:hypothetical protein [Bacteroidota bacterium]
MKKQILYLLTVSLIIVFTACKKNSTSNNNNEMATHSDDQSQVTSEIDDVANDADVTLESSASFTGRYQGVQGVICDASVVMNTTSNPRTITITYDGTNCFGNRTRTGVVIISMAQGVQWKNAGAAVTVTFQNLKITRVSDNKSITINGSQTYTNVSGGLLVSLPASGGSITHAITSDGLTITFDNGSQRSWQVAKQRVFTYSSGLVITTTGTHVDGNNTGIAEWGTNRFGNAFSTSFVEPLVVRQDCNFRLTSGQVKHITPAVTATATFGLNASGDPTTCPGTGHYYCKVVWNGSNGNSLTVIFPY